MQTARFEWIKAVIGDELRQLAAAVAPDQLHTIEMIKNHLESGDYRLKPTTCPCGERTAVKLTESDRFGLPLPYVICSGCGVIRQQECFDEASLQHFYQHYFRRLYRASRALGDRFFRRQYRRSYAHMALFRKHLPSDRIKRVLDYGCSAGGYVKAFNDVGFKASGVDYDETYLTFGRDRYGLDLRFGGLDAIEGETFDLITINHVLEHIADPCIFIESLSAVRHDDTFIYIGVPGVDSFFLRKPEPLSAQFHLAHIYVFSQESLNRVLSKLGYDAVYSDSHINAIFRRSDNRPAQTAEKGSEAVLHFFYQWFRQPMFRAWQTLSRSWPYRIRHTIVRSKGKSMARKNL